MSDQEEVAMEDQVEEPKKGRGALKKPASKVKADVEASDEPPVKRGRGRPPGTGRKAAKGKPAPKPKKQTVDEDADEDAGNGEVEDEDTDKAPPRGRGRPPKAAAKGAKAKAAKAKPDTESEPEEEEDDSSEHEEPAPPAKAKNGKAAVKPAAKNGHSDVDEEADEADQADEDADEGKSDDASSDSKIKIVVEHCKSCHTYRRKAEEIISALKEKWSGIEVDYNPKAPRKGSFEFNLINDSGKEVQLWTGLKLGPPRKLKFPDPEVVVDEMSKVYDSEKE